LIRLRSFIIPVLLVVAVFSTACSSSESTDSVADIATRNEPTPTPVITLENGITHVVVHLSPTEGEGQIGTAVFVSDDSSTTSVEVSITPSSTEAQPIHLHSGICTDVGPVLHALQNVVKGSSLTVIDKPLNEIIKDGALVNVHASYTNAATYTACGMLPVELP